MYLVYLNNGPGGKITSMKCHVLPVDGYGKDLPLVAKFPLKEEEFLLPLKALERLYPFVPTVQAPEVLNAEAGQQLSKESQSTEMETQDITWKGHPSISDL
jgi:hypothetical protein